MSRLVVCPLCERSFHYKLVESHAASCPGRVDSSAPTCPATHASRGTLAASDSMAASIQPTLRAGTSANPLGPLRRSQAHDRPGKQTRRSLSLPEFDYLVVLDFEWTCDDTGTLAGGSEIIEFPSVLLRLKPGGITEFVSELQLYVRPERNPTLTRFCKDLTGITQAQVDNGLNGLETALGKYREWLVQQQLLPPIALSSPTEGGEQNRAGPSWPRFALVTWSDADLGSQLYTECERKGLHHARPWWFRSWINLKPLYAQHYCREARGGLQACVEATGQTFDGRAHSGLVDARNTAKIVENMREQGFKFVRTTRGCDAQGIPYGRDTNRTGGAAREPSHKRLRTGAAS